LQGLYRAFDETDASLAEINPLILTGSGDVVALDAKMTFDDNALFRHSDIVALRDLDEEDPAEIEASKFDLSYISLDGNIGCLVNGAGLAMATMDITKLYGGSPANFLDVGGGASAEKVTEAFKIMLKNPHVKAILVNIFGGIMKCDVIAEGIVTAARQVKLTVPLVVRLEGTNVDLGKKILADSGLPIISASNMADAAAKVVKATGGTGKPQGETQSAGGKPAAKAKPAAKRKTTARKIKPRKSKLQPKAKAKAKAKPKAKSRSAKKAVPKRSVASGKKRKQRVKSKPAKKRTVRKASRKSAGKGKK
jgi:succinyl-CoA synthetase beta subunit